MAVVVQRGLQDSLRLFKAGACRKKSMPLAHSRRNHDRPVHKFAAQDARRAGGKLHLIGGGEGIALVVERV